MKGIILAGGTGSRLAPLTKITNKHLIGIYDRPMIEYPINTLRDVGVDDFIIVSGREHAGHFLEYLGSGIDFGVNFTYRVQEKAGGIAQALGLCKNFIGKDEQFIVMLGDNIFAAVPNILLRERMEAKVFLKRVNDADRFGVAKFDINKEIESIVEKPKEIKNGYAVTGLYIYPNSVFEVVERLKPSWRGELEITDVNQYYARLKVLDYEILDGFWTDAGQPESLARATQWAIKERIKDGKHPKN